MRKGEKIEIAARDLANADEPARERIFGNFSNHLSVEMATPAPATPALHLPDEHALEVMDFYQPPHLAATEQIVAARTLVKRSPRPLSQLLASLSDTERAWKKLGPEKK